jgi:hypothetical protein
MTLSLLQLSSFVFVNGGSVTPTNVTLLFIVDEMHR